MISLRLRRVNDSSVVGIAVTVSVWIMSTVIVSTGDLEMTILIV